MNGSLQYSALTRLLTLNTRVHDLQKEILLERVGGPANRIASMQEEIERWSRASLATCWLSDEAGAAHDYEDEDEGEELV